MSVISMWLSWSFAAGIIYSLLRCTGARVPSVEWYFQHVPLGLTAASLRNDREGHAPDLVAPELAPSSTATSKLDLERFLSVEYVRYAGILLVVSALFSFLFKIEWSLPYKIIASFSIAVLFMGVTEFFRTKWSSTVIGVFFLGAFASTQFGLTLCAKYWVVPGSESVLAQLNFWILAKILLTLLGAAALKRYTASFLPPALFITAWSAPIAFSYVGLPLCQFPPFLNNSNSTSSWSLSRP